MIDDGASACITNDRDDFIEPPTRVNQKVRGIKGHAKAPHRGMIDTIPTRNGRELGEIWVSKVGTNF